MAGSVTSTSESEWDDAVVAATGGRELRPDPGLVEVTRGTVAGTEWLLQAMSAPLRAGAFDADHCLRVTGGRRVCADALSLGQVDWLLRSSAAGGGLPPFVLTTVEGTPTVVRVTAGDQVVTTPFVRLPGNVPRSVAITFVDRPGLPGCGGEPNPGHLSTMRVEVLSPGAAPRCLHL